MKTFGQFLTEKFERVTIRGHTFNVWINPTISQLKMIFEKSGNMNNKASYGIEPMVRGWKDYDNVWYVWDASVATHSQVIKAMDLSAAWSNNQFMTTASEAEKHNWDINKFTQDAF